MITSIFIKIILYYPSWSLLMSPHEFIFHFGVFRNLSFLWSFLPLPLIMELLRIVPFQKYCRHSKVKGLWIVFWSFSMKVNRTIAYLLLEKTRRSAMFRSVLLPFEQSFLWKNLHTKTSVLDYYLLYYDVGTEAFDVGNYWCQVYIFTILPACESFYKGIKCCVGEAYLGECWLFNFMQWISEEVFDFDGTWTQFSWLDSRLWSCFHFNWYIIN